MEAGWDYASFDKDEAGLRKDVQASATEKQNTDTFQKSSMVKGLQYSWPPPGPRRMMMAMMMIMIITMLIIIAPPPPN